MGLPTQGMGTTTNWSADGSGYDAGPYALPNDGSQWSFATVMVLLARIINSLGALYSGGAMQVAAYSGTIWTIAAGSLQTYLRELADKAAKVDAPNVWSGNQSFASLSSSILATLNGVLITQSLEKAHHAVSASATTYTYVVTDGPVVIIDQWDHVSGVLSIALQNPTSAPGKRFEVEFYFYPTNAAHNVVFRRNTLLASVTAGFQGPGYAKWRWDGTSWRVGPIMPLSGNWAADYSSPALTG